jgi:hypothetical protein
MHKSAIDAVLFGGKIANLSHKRSAVSTRSPSGAVSAVKRTQCARLSVLVSQSAGRLIGKLRVGAAAEVVIIRSSINFVFIG